MKRTITCLLSLALGAAVSAQAGVTGQWEFNGGYTAAVGTAIQPQGAAIAGSQFGTTTFFGIPDINGQVAQVMQIPAMKAADSRPDGYKMFHGAAANGSTTTDVNQYTLVMDVLYPSTSTGYRALLQTSDVNGNDADWFINGANGLGISSVYNGNLTPDAWHRIALVVDLDQADASKRFSSFIDGTFVGTSTLSSGAGGRWALYPASLDRPAWIFSDEDGEGGLGYVNSVQFSDYAMTAAQIALLGGPSAAGITVVPEPAAGLLLLAGLGLMVRRNSR